MLGDTERSFEDSWKAGKLPGWLPPGRGAMTSGGAGGRGIATPRALDLKRSKVWY